MFKTGWMRLWTVATVFLIVGTLVFSGFYVWGQDIVYRFVSVTISDSTQPRDRALAESTKQEATTKTFTGKIHYSPLLTLESLGKRGAVTQVAFEWLEPSGWSCTDHNDIDILNQTDIKASEITGRVSRYVYRARARRAGLFLVCAIAFSTAALATGIGIAWVRRGFATQ